MRKQKSGTHSDSIGMRSGPRTKRERAERIGEQRHAVKEFILTTKLLSSWQRLDALAR
jgi:hypothetical protein